MRREGIRQSECRGELGTEQRGTQNVQRDVGAGAGSRTNTFDAGLIAEVTLEFEDVTGEAVGVGHGAAQRTESLLVAARCAAQTEIDTAGVEFGEGAELLGDGER